MNYVGQSIKRFEDPRLVTGNGAFVGDLTLPDMLHAAILRSQHAHARLRAVDVSAARALPGVAAILTGADIVGVLPGIPTRAMTGERAVDALQAPEYPLLAHAKVCYVGQPIAVVVAHNPYVARDAVELITVDYEPLVPVLDPDAAARDEAPVIHEAMGTNVAMRLCQRAGDLEGAFTQADHVVRQRYVVQRVVPAPLETRGVLARYQPQEDLLTVWNATQAPHRVKHFLVHLLRRPEQTVRVVAPDNVCRRITGPYHIPALSIELVGVLTNKTSIGAYRGTGSPEAAFCIERTMDLIAHDLGLDPAEVRWRNFIPADAFPYQAATGLTYDSGNYAQGLERILEMVDYPHWRARARQQKPDEPLIGIGLATFLKSSGAAGDHRVESAQVTIAPSGDISVYTGISPHGQGSETSFAQIVADALGVHPAQVQIRHSDTALFPFGEGTSASRGLIVGGSAVYAMGQEARQHLAHLASELLACPAEDICFQNGQVYNRYKPEEQLTFAQLVAAASSRAQGPVEGESGLVFSGRYTLQAAPFSFGAHAVVVEVSRETGQVTILRYVGVHDCSRIINPRLVEGQITGGIAQGLGQALTEGMVYSPEGQPLTGSLLDYALPRAQDVPQLILETLEVPSPTNPLGAKGIGSVSTVPAPAAVANAVLDALAGFGVRHIDTPLTAEKLWRAMQGVGESQ